MHPIFLKLGPLEIRWYGVLIAIGFLAAIGLASKRVKGTGLDPEVVPSVGFWMMAGGFAMARVFYVVQNWREYAAHPIEIIRIDHGGIVYYGGLIGGVLATIIFARVRKMNFWQIADLMTPSLVLAHAFGRLGCFMNGCCYGTACNHFWGVQFPVTTVADWGPGAPYGPVHPTQLYEAAFLFYFCVALIFIDRLKKFQGQTFSTYAMIYSMFRFTVEFWRGDVPRFSHLTSAQWLSLFIFFVAWWWLARNRKLWALARRAERLSQINNVQGLKKDSGARNG